MFLKNVRKIYYAIQMLTTFRDKQYIGYTLEKEVLQVSHHHLLTMQQTYFSLELKFPNTCLFVIFVIILMNLKQIFFAIESSSEADATTWLIVVVQLAHVECISEIDTMKIPTRELSA